MFSCPAKRLLTAAAIGLLGLVPLAPTKAAATEVPPSLKEVVTFVFLKGEGGTYIPLGTAFFVGLEQEKPHRGFGYLVTARHVLQNDKHQFFPTVYIRLNKKSGGAEIIEIPLVGKDAPPVYQHAEADVDLAVIPMLPNQLAYEFKFVAEDLLAAKEHFDRAQIKEGDDVFFPGLFWQFVGEKRNYPIVRFGRTAMVTEEKIPWRGKDGTEMLDLFLVEAQSSSGNSGAPVFIHVGRSKEKGKDKGKPELMLGGVIKGTFLAPKAVVRAEKNPPPLALHNMGVAAVIPAYKLHEILFSPRLREARAKNP